MKKFLLLLGVLGATILATESASAQIQVGEGQISGAVESNNIYYGPDKKLENLGLMQRPELPFGSHDFIKVDYSIGRFSAGIQLDGYLPPMDGYDISTYKQRDTKLTGFLTKYVQWEDTNYGIRLGDIYDQFGNGLIFRTYEDRALGFNNALAGARAYYNFNNYVSVKAIAGMPRLYDVRNTNWVYGADLSLSISDMAGWTGGMVSIEGSYIGRYQHGASTDEMLQYTGITGDYLNMVSGRLNFEAAGFTLRGEYAAKLNEDLYSAMNAPAKGNVVHVDLGYSHRRFSASATFRRYEKMQTPITLSAGALGGGNTLNYLPLLTRQHTYMLASLNPYQGSGTGDEIGGQFDVYYSLRNKKDRTKYWNFHANFSLYYSMDYDMYGTKMEGRPLWLDVNADVERQWGKHLKTTLFYSHQQWDDAHGLGIEAHNYSSDIIVADVTYKFNKKYSMRVEAQYLASNNYEGDWVAGLIEFNIAPKFSFYVSDMWNCEAMEKNTFYDENGNEYNELLHYYQVGASFTHSRFRAQLSYGRNRAGYVCSGGVCRYQPAYTGINLSLTASF